MKKEDWIRLLLNAETAQRSTLLLVADSQESFDNLFLLMFNNSMPLAIKAADALIVISEHRPELLNAHKAQLLEVLTQTRFSFLKWHAAHLTVRLDLDSKEEGEVWRRLTYWSLNRNESKLVRANSLQSLFVMSRRSPVLREEYNRTLSMMSREPIPSLQTRIKKLKAMEHMQ